MAQVTSEQRSTTFGGRSFGNVVADSIAVVEHRSNLERFRIISVVGIVLWGLLIGTDAIMAYIVAPGPLWPYAVLRLAGLPLFGLLFYVTRPTHDTSPRLFQAVEAVLLIYVAWAVSLMCAFSGGMHSMYITGIAATTVARGVAVCQPWRQAVPVNVLMIAGLPLAMAVAAPFSPEIAAQWTDVQSLGSLVTGIGLLSALAVLSVMGGHFQWALRREAIESRNVGRYEIGERLGQGGMGDIWRARIRGSQQEVALKLLRSPDADALGRFEREVAALAALHHPNTVRVFDFGVTEAGVPYFAMELLFGRTLDRTVAERGPLPVGRAVAIARQVASALAEAHRKGIVHRDVKPANIMVVDGTHGDDHTKLLDFGIARNNTIENDALTRAGTVIGTPAYIAPEAILGRPPDPRSDVYAVGATLFFMLAGRPPYVGKTADILVAHRSAEIPRLLELGVVVPAWVDAVIERCLAKDPDARFADGAALALALDRTAPEDGVAVPTTDATATVEFAGASNTIQLDTPVPVERKRP